MRAITATIAVLGLFGAMIAAAPARADDDDFGGGWRHREWHEHQWREQRWREHEWREHALQSYPPPVAYGVPGGYYAAQPSYYGPPPVYYVPAPSPPPPVYAAPGFSIGFSFR